MTTTALVSGAGIAGATLAYWLDRHGVRPTLVETAPAPRPGGQAVDVRGPAMTVADRMGVGEALRAARTRMRGMSMLAADGTELMSTTETTLTGGPLDGPDVEVLRDDLTAILLGITDVEVRYGDRIVGLTRRPDGVEVCFAGGAQERYDLVVGADGLHSGLRATVFDPAEVTLRHLGSHLAVYTMPNRFDLDRWQVFCQLGDRMAGVYTARENREVRVNLGFYGPTDAYDHRDVAAQKARLAEAFADDGWWIPQLLAGMAEAGDFYLAPMTQVLMPRWTTERVALLGDAAWCATPLSGQGTSLAMVGAYVLAGELGRAADHEAAFAAYERRMRPFVTANQELAIVAEQRTRDQFLGSGDGAEQATAGFDEHWVASAATAIELPEYRARVSRRRR